MRDSGPNTEESFKTTLATFTHIEPKHAGISTVLVLRREVVKRCGAWQNFISQCYLVVSGINDEFVKMHSPYRTLLGSKSNCV